MKLLLLFLAIFLAVEPVMSEEECWSHGHCRLVCNDDEDHVLRCVNRKRCCVPSRYVTMKPITIDYVLDWTTPTVPTTVPTTVRKRKKNKKHGRG
ncbi:beta-defensin 119 isoform X1 [Ictidomys tridecemlineatus]|uniref:Beta-defensin n=2 Tax=Ictidomys tridecemlineatus TaxID=43179 RepID=I3M4H8_ICTTR